MTSHNFRHDLGDEVQVLLIGRVVARTNSIIRHDRYLVEYQADGRTIREWKDGATLEVTDND